jgi:DNA-binding CsgD family transcriptional regulator
VRADNAKLAGDRGAVATARHERDDIVPGVRAQPRRKMQPNTLKYVTLFLVGGVAFFLFDVASDIYERLIANNAPDLLELLHLLFEILSAAALMFAIRILLREMRRLHEHNDRQSQSLMFLRGEMDTFVRGKFQEWNLSPAESDIVMFMLKGLSIADIAKARSTAEGTVKAQTTNIFRKTGVSSRTELMSVFMDEFLDVGATLEPSLK